MNKQISEEKKQCQAITKRGSQCRVLVAAGNQHCLFHRDPTRAAELGRKGGLRNRRYALLPGKPATVPQTATDVKGFLAEAMAEVRAGRLDPKIATSLAYIAGPLLKTIELADLEARLVRLEQESQTVEDADTKQKLN